MWRVLAVALFCAGLFFAPDHLRSQQLMLQNVGTYSVASSGGGCSQDTAYQAALDGGQNASAITTAVCASVSNGTWAKLDWLYVFDINSSANALVNAVAPGTFNGTANGAPTFTGNSGFLGVDQSATKYIDTNFNAATAAGQYAQNSAHVSIWSFTNAASSTLGGAVLGNNNNS